MKRFILTLFAAFCLFSASAAAQEPTEGWPYLYDNFILGKVRSTDGTLLEDVRLNICVGDGTLHYINASDGKIIAAKMLTVFSAKIGEDLWLRAGLKMMKVILESDEAAVLELAVVDEEKLGATDIGYGIESKTASSTKLTSYAFSTGMVGMNIEEVVTGKSRGRELPLKYTYYLRAGKRIVQASKRQVLEIEGIDKAAANAFFKENKIKWKNPESLLKVAGFLMQYED